MSTPHTDREEENGLDRDPDQDQDQDGYAQFEALHSAALRAAALPRNLWKSLFYKISNEVFDAGEVFGILQVQDDSEDTPLRVIGSKVVVTRESGLKKDDPDSVFLVDHAWTYRMPYARQQLLEVPGLMPRMAALFGLDFHGDVPDPDSLELVLELMWKHNQTYHLSLGSAEEKVPVWYVMDEFGSQIQHSDRPSCGLAPFYCVSEQLAYSVLWPLHDLDHGDEVTRDFAYGETDALVRRCRLLPWKPDELNDVSSDTCEPPDQYYQAIFQENGEQLPEEVEPFTVPHDKVLK